MKALHQLFPDLLRKQPQKQFPFDEVVRVAWAQLVGPHIAARSRVFRLYKQTLIVHVSDRNWQKQLHRMERRLLARVQAMLGASYITAMDFRVDPALALLPLPAAVAAAADPPRKGPARQNAPALEADAELEESARAIADPEMRDLFLRASRKMMR